MIKRVTALTVTLLLLIGMVNAIQVTEITQGLESNSAEITGLKAEMSSRLSIIEQRIDTLATEDEMTNLLNGSLALQQQLLDNFRILLTVSFILIILAGIGLAYSIYFYFKSKGRL